MSKRVQRFAWLLPATLLAACNGDRAENVPGQNHATNQMELFDKNRGVRLPPEMQRSLGVTTAEVTEKLVTSRVEKMARVYRAHHGNAPAAAVSWLSEAEAAHLRVRQNVRLNRPGTEATSVLATLVRLGKSPSAAPDPVEALIEFDDAEERFAPGSSLLATFAGERAHSALAVPATSIIHGASGPFVYAANGEHFIRTPVKPGATMDGWVEITDGVYAGDIVVAKAVDSLWLIELCALKGGTPCCPVPARKVEE